MIERLVFDERLAYHARVSKVAGDDVLFRTGLDLSSLAFAEFIMEIEEIYGLDIDPDALDSSIKTANQLFAKLDDLARLQLGR